MQKPGRGRIEARQGDRCGVLVAEDNPGIRGILDSALRARRFDVWLAGDGAEAIEIFTLHAHTIDVVLLDICMPKVDGMEALSVLRTMTPQVPCCLMSGDSSAHTHESIRNSGAKRFFAKPFCIDALCDALREIAWSAPREQRSHARSGRSATTASEPVSALNPRPKRTSDMKGKTDHGLEGNPSDSGQRRG